MVVMSRYRAFFLYFLDPPALRGPSDGRRELDYGGHPQRRLQVLQRFGRQVTGFKWDPAHYSPTANGIHKGQELRK